MGGKPFGDLDGPTIDALIKAGWDEGRRLDFKAELPGGSDKDKRELCADVASLANTAGGHLVFGVRDEDGRAVGIEPITEPPADPATLRLEQTVRSGVEPNVTLRTRPVEVEGGYVLLMEVPRSFAGPHAIKVNDALRFFGRDSRGKRSLDFYDVRAAFQAGGALADRIRGFHLDRLAGIIGGVTPVAITESVKLVAHVVPADAFDPSAAYDISDPDVYWHPLRQAGDAGDVRFNLDGYLASGQVTDDVAEDYAQLYRSGIVEVVSDERPRVDSGHFVFHPHPVERDLLEKVKAALRVLTAIGAEPPVYVLSALVGLRGTLAEDLRGGFRSPDRRRPILRDVVRLPDVLVADTGVIPDRTMRPACDALWNISGVATSPFFNERGEYRPQ